MIRTVMGVTALATLAACATPQQSCIASVTRDARVLDSLIAETQANLARGFAVEEVEELRTRNRTCVGRNEDGTEFRFRCPQTDTVTRQVPVAIDLQDERRKLETLLQRQEQNRVNVEAGISQCLARYPE